MKWLLPLASLALLAGCAGGPGGGPPGGRGRDRPPLPPQAQPTSVIATELAFARAAREEGQWTAYSRFAESGAQVQWDGASGSAERWLAGRTNPETADLWVPRQAWSSCDGSAVVVVGTSADPAGNWSRFTRVWERQGGGEFRWRYTMMLPDAELTRARQDEERERAEDAARGDAILVEAGNFIRAKVADCRTPPALPTADTAAMGGMGGGTGLSKDRTLRWEWAPSETGPASFVAYSWNGEGWDTVHSEPVAVAGE